MVGRICEEGESCFAEVEQDGEYLRIFKYGPSKSRVSLVRSDSPEDAEDYYTLTLGNANIPGEVYESDRERIKINLLEGLRSILFLKTASVAKEILQVLAAGARR